MNRPHFVYLFIPPWTFGLFPPLGSCECCCCERGCHAFPLDPVQAGPSFHEHPGHHSALLTGDAIEQPFSRNTFRDRSPLDWRRLLRQGWSSWKGASLVASPTSVSSHLLCQRKLSWRLLGVGEPPMRFRGDGGVFLCDSSCPGASQ